MSVQARKTSLRFTYFFWKKLRVPRMQKWALIHLVNISKLLFGHPEQTLHTAQKTTAQKKVLVENSRRE